MESDREVAEQEEEGGGDKGRVENEVVEER